MTNRLYIILFSVLIFFITPITTILAADTGTNDLLVCNNFACLKQVIYQTGKPLPLKECNALNNKRSTDFYKSDMGLMCRMLISRKQAGKRAEHQCTDDYEYDLPSTSIELYKNRLLRKLTNKYKDKGMGKHLSYSSGSSSGTSMSTYVYTTGLRSTTKNDSIDYSLKIFFCVGGDKPKNMADIDTAKYLYYQPYYYEFSFSKTSNKVLVDEINDYTYLENPALAKVKVLQQLNRKIEDNMKQPELADINKDGELDLIFIDEKMKYDRTTPGYRVGVCLYQAEQSFCRQLMGKPVNSDIFGHKQVVSVTKDSKLLLEFKNSRTPPQQAQYVYKLGADKLVLQ